MYESQETRGRGGGAKDNKLINKIMSAEEYNLYNINSTLYNNTIKRGGREKGGGVSLQIRGGRRDENFLEIYEIRQFFYREI